MSDTPDRTDEPTEPVGPIEPEPIETGYTIEPVDPNFVKEGDDDDAVTDDD